MSSAFWRKVVAIALFSSCIFCLGFRLHKLKLRHVNSTFAHALTAPNYSGLRELSVGVVDAVTESVVKILASAFRMMHALTTLKLASYSLLSDGWAYAPHISWHLPLVSLLELDGLVSLPVVHAPNVVSFKARGDVSTAAALALVAICHQAKRLQTIRLESFYQPVIHNSAFVKFSEHLASGCWPRLSDLCVWPRFDANGEVMRVLTAYPRQNLFNLECGTQSSSLFRPFCCSNAGLQVLSLHFASLADLQPHSDSDDGNSATQNDEENSSLSNLRIAIADDRCFQRLRFTRAEELTLGALQNRVHLSNPADVLRAFPSLVTLKLLHMTFESHESEYASDSVRALDIYSGDEFIERADSLASLLCALPKLERLSFILDNNNGAIALDACVEAMCERLERSGDLLQHIREINFSCAGNGLPLPIAKRLVLALPSTLRRFHPGYLRDSTSMTEFCAWLAINRASVTV